MSLNLSLSTQDGAVVIQADGRVDSSNASEFEDAAISALSSTGRSLIFDLSKLVYMSSAGLRVLLVTLKAGRAKGADVVLAAPQPNVLQVLEMSGFAKMFTLHATTAAEQAP